MNAITKTRRKGRVFQFSRRALLIIDDVLHGNPLRLAFGLKLAVAADDFARDFFYFAFGLLDAAFDAIFVHGVLTMRDVAIMEITFEHPRRSLWRYEERPRRLSATAVPSLRR